MTQSEIIKELVEKMKAERREKEIQTEIKKIKTSSVSKHLAYVQE